MFRKVAINVAVGGFFASAAVQCIQPGLHVTGPLLLVAWLIGMSHSLSRDSA